MKQDGEHGSFNPIMPAQVVVQDVAGLAQDFARLVEDAARLAIAQRRPFALAVPGGSAAEALLPALIPAAIDWSKVAVFWVDERMVPADDPQSNFGLAKRVWLDEVPISAEQIHRMHGDDAVPGEAAAAYTRILREKLSEPARIDLVLLGVGADGHVASLFPGHRLLRAWDRDVAVLSDAPKPPPRRMTLTLRAITAARRIVVFAAGAAKADAIQDALRNEDSDLPLALATMGDAPVTFLLDPDAASKLS
jgi:6-phosphogluconolactonase